MNLEQFIVKRPYLYHLTNAENAENIIYEKKLLSANRIISLSGDNTNTLNRQKRFTHKEIFVGEKRYYLRDQRPISEVALAKCLTDNWKVPDFIYHLNDRVFMWPTLERLWRHFNRYEAENPVILRFSTEQLLEANPHAKFCRLNSGATRANSHLGGKAPERGQNSFLSAETFPNSIREVAEVTFENECVFDISISQSTRPDGIFIDAS